MKIIFFTLAYNAEKTLRRAVRSVLNQTYKDFTYWIIDNGSTDKTRDIIRRYSSIDSRVIPFYHDENNLYRSYDYFKRLADEFPDGKLVVLDSDDEYDIHFLYDIINFSVNNRLDLAASGNEFISALDKSHLGNRAVSQNVVIKKNQPISISLYHSIMRPVWGKLLPLDIIGKLDFSLYYSIRYGADTAFILDIISKCNSFGIMRGVYYHYYVNPASDSYTWDNNRIQADAIMYNHLIQHCITMNGNVSDENMSFIKLVYLNAIDDTINVLLNSTISPKEKLNKLKQIINREQSIDTLTYIKLPSVEVKKKIDKWLAAIEKLPVTDDQIWLGMNLSSFIDDQKSYVQYSLLNIGFLIEKGLLDEAQKELEEWKQLIPDEPIIHELEKFLTEES